jgi:putative peptidoglycan lipid II flippase
MPSAASARAKDSTTSSSRNAAIVAAAIFLSRTAGLVRERVFAHYFGNSMAADAFKAALRIPNLLQNLFGEGVLSASFIPVYARLRAQGRDKDAAHVASAVASMLAVVISVLVAAGVATTPWIIDLVAPGFQGEKRQATIHLVRILFPGTGLLVASAWCLGVLNSHRKFFLSYVAPVVWNAAQIGTLVAFGRNTQGYELAAWVAWGAVAGSGLQFGVQLPTVLRLVRELRPCLGTTSEHVREVARNFVPVVFGRGVVQLSAYIDSVLASWLPNGAVAAIAYAQILYTLPISMFGMAVSAAELPEMSSLVGHKQQVYDALRKRIAGAILRIAYFIVPTSIGFLALGDVIAGVLFQTGRFGHNDAVWVWTILAGSTVGLVAATMGRLYASAFYALRDTRTPLRYALLRLALTASLGWLFSLVLPGRLGISASWGAAGLTASAGLAGWVEFLLLRRNLHKRIGKIKGSGREMSKLWLSAAIAAAVAWGARSVVARIGPLHPVVAGIIVLTPYGLVYLSLTWLFQVDQARTVVARVRQRLKRSPRLPR